MRQVKHTLSHESCSALQWTQWFSLGSVDEGTTHMAM